MAGLIKIGKTTRTPEERAKELSASTGVPIPFVVAFYESFRDCSLAEEYVHAMLDGYRHSEDREFFAVELNTVTRAIMEAKQALGMQKDDDATVVSNPHRTVGVEALRVDQRSLICFDLINKFNALFNDAASIINDSSHEDMSPDVEDALIQLQSSLNEYGAETQDTLLAAEDDLVDQWEILQSVFIAAATAAADAQRESDQLDALKLALDEVAAVIRDWKEKRNVLGLAIVLSHGTTMMKAYIDVLSREEVTAVDSKTGLEEINHRYESALKVIDELSKSLFGALANASLCVSNLLGIINKIDLNELDCRLLMLLQEHGVDDVIIPAYGALIAATTLAQMSAGHSSPIGSDNLEAMPWSDVLREADRYYYGDESTIPDIGRALKLYKRAAKLGCGQAYVKLADLLASDDISASDPNKAIEWLKEGADRGLADCVLGLADIFSGRNWVFPKELQNRDYEAICYRNFFRQVDVGNFSDRDIYIRLKQYLRCVQWGPEEVDRNIVSKVFSALRAQLESSPWETEDNVTAKLDQLNALQKEHKWAVD
ncbi:MAG: GIY-YIG nuclease family protein [Thiogranum sp.]|nr:GIY-YIG nuclease family protein [Thiogranum sp.]